jgi:putative ABC transport system substrate-binding protein
MERREFITLLGGAAILPAIPASVAVAQAPSRVYRIGLLGTLGPPGDNTPFVAPLIKGLAARGYTPGRNLAFERRGAEGKLEQLPRLIEELAGSKVDVIFTVGYPPALAVKERKSIPAAVIAVGDPVATGLIESLALPGGNLVGISDLATELTAKRLELLKDIKPGLRRVAMLWNAADMGMTLRYRASEETAKAMGIIVQPLGVREPDDFEEAFASMNRDMPDAILMVADMLTTLKRSRVFDFAAAHRLPAIYEWNYFVRDGGLMSYSMDLDDGLGRVAALIDRILKGAKPAEFPFEQATRFTFALNLKTAKALGIDVPANVHARADEVIE